MDHVISVTVIMLQKLMVDNLIEMHDYNVILTDSFPMFTISFNFKKAQSLELFLTLGTFIIWLQLELTSKENTSVLQVDSFLRFVNFYFTHQAKEFEIWVR